MTKRCSWHSLLPILVCVTVGIPNDAVAQERPNLLYLTEPAAWVHTVLPVAEEVMRALGEKPGAFDVTVIRSAEQITKDTLTNYDVVAFNTTGELPMAASKQEALLEFVRNGGGFVGVGDTYLFLTLAAVVVGGTSLLGGWGGYGLSVIGVLVLQVLNTTLIGWGLSFEGQQFILGLLIIPMVALYARSPHIRTLV